MRLYWDGYRNTPQAHIQWQVGSTPIIPTIKINRVLTYSVIFIIKMKLWKIKIMLLQVYLRNIGVL